jgi:hypothetical protein
MMTAFPDETKMDLHNNSIGRAIGARYYDKSTKERTREATDYFKSGLPVNSLDYWLDKGCSSSFEAMLADKILYQLNYGNLVVIKQETYAK